MNDLDRPIVVAVAPVGEASWSGVGPVGVLRFRDRGASKLAIAVRVVGSFPEEGRPLVPGFPMPASSPVPALAGLPPLSGRELVPWKPLCDVALVGTVARPGVHLGPHAMPLEIAIGEINKSRQLETAEEGGGGAERRGRRANHGVARVEGQVLDADLDHRPCAARARRYAAAASA